MNILITVDFIDDNAQHVTNDFANGIILHIDKEEITSDDIIHLKADMRNLITGLHDPKRYLSSGLFKNHKKEFIDVTLKMYEPNNASLLLQAVQALRESHI